MFFSFLRRLKKENFFAWWSLFFLFFFILILILDFGLGSGKTNFFSRAAETQTITLQLGVGGYSGVSSTYIHAWYPESNFNSLNRLLAYTASSYILIKFELPGIPQNALINEATLTLYSTDKYSSGTSPLYLETYQLLRPWNPLKATWVQANKDEEWSFAGAADTFTDRKANFLSSQTISASGTYYNFSLTSAVQQWVSYPKTNHGVIIIARSGAGVGYWFADETYPQVAVRPKLTIRYTVSSSNDLPPYVKLISPSHESFLSGIVPLSANAQDDRGVSKIEYYLDDQLISSPLNTSAFSLGKHILKVKVFDSNNQSAEDSIMVYFYKKDDGIITIAQISDAHVGSYISGEIPGSKDQYPSRLKAIISEINSIIKPAVIIDTGDLVSAPSVDNYRIYNEIVATSKIPLKIIPGNHDLTDGGNAFRNTVGQARKVFDLDNYRFIGYPTGKLATYQDWVTNLLSSASGKKIIFSHYPIDLPSQYADKTLYQMPAAEKSLLQNLISTYGVSFYLSGHVHEHFIIEDSLAKVTNLSSLATTQKSAYEVIALDNGVISSNVVNLNDKPRWPFIVITYPQQYYGRDENKKVSGLTKVRAKVFDDVAVTSVSYRINQGNSVSMENKGEGVWEKEWDTSSLAPGRYTLTVSATDVSGRRKQTSVVIKVVSGGETPTPTPTPILTLTPTPTSTPQPTPTSIPTPTPTPSPSFCPDVCPKITSWSSGPGCYVRLSWTAINGAASYRIYRNQAYKETTQTTYTWNWLPCNATSLYSVSPVFPNCPVKSCSGIWIKTPPSQ